MGVGMPSNVSDVLAPRERMTASEWVMKHPYVVKEKGAARAGPYDMDWTPFWREPLDAMGDPTVMAENIVASSQCGKTVTVMGGLLYLADRMPVNTMYVRPTLPDLKEAFEDRFKVAIETNLPHLIQGNNWMTVGENPVIRLATSLIYGAAATVARHATSRTAPRSWYDEVDSGDVGSNALGDMLELMSQRGMAASALYSLLLGSSTPKDEMGPNWIGYDKYSDRREYWEPCPLCGAYQTLEPMNLVAVDGCKDPRDVVDGDLARFRCVCCGEMIEPRWQGWMSDRGLWVPKGQKVEEVLPLEDEVVVEMSKTLTPDGERWEPSLAGEPARSPSHRGYRIWRANTKFELCAWSRILGRRLKAYASKDPEKIQVFVNNDEALPFKESRRELEEEQLLACRRQYEPGVVPARAKLVLGSIDLQGDMIRFRFRAFGPNQTSWGIEDGWLPIEDGNHLPALDALYDRVMREGWPWLGGERMRMRCLAMVVDSGAWTDTAYEFARLPGVVPIKGVDTASYRVKLTEVERKMSAETVELYLLNTRVTKDRVMRRITTTREDATAREGGWFIEPTIQSGDPYVREMLAERLMPKKKNKSVLTWQKVKDRQKNEAFDLEGYIEGLQILLEMRQEVVLSLLSADDPPYAVFREDVDPTTVPVRGEVAPKIAPEREYLEEDGHDWAGR